MKKARRWEHTSSKRSIRDSVWDRLLREFYPRADQPERRPHAAPRPAAKARRQSFALEPIEPRLLMSADLSYSGTGPFTLSASGNVLNIVDSSTNSNVAHYTVPAGSQTVTIQR